MNVTIRRLTENEWLEFSRIRLQALLTDPQVFGSNYEKESQMLETDWRERLRAEDNAIFLIYAGDTPVGMTSVSVDRNDSTGKNRAFVGFVARAVRSRQRFIGTNVSNAHRMGESAAVRRKNHRFASSLKCRVQYANQKHGFVLTHKNEKVWNDGVTEDELFYELKIKF
jgi:hypothetical protein